MSDTDSSELSASAPVVSRFLAPGGAHVVVSGTVADLTLQVSCEGCGRLCGVYRRAAHETDADVVASALRAGQRHAETCRCLPKRLWP